MSNAVPNSVIVAEYQANLADNYTSCLTTTLACYEYLLLLEHEYRFLRCRWTSVTWLFIANRYCMLASVLTLIMPYTPRTCYNVALQGFPTVITFMPGVVAAVFSALRVFALLNRSYVMAVIVLCLGLVPFATGVYIIAHTSYYYVDDPVLGASCYGTFTLPTSDIFYSNGVAARLSVITADILVVVATWSRTVQQVRRAAGFGIRGISATLLRDGSIYFIALTVLNVARLLVDTIPSWQSGNPVSNITDVMQPILISRFIINLRQANEGGISTSTGFEDLSHFTLPVFRIPTIAMDTIIGSLGQPLEYKTSDESESVDDCSSEVLTNGQIPMESQRAVQEYDDHTD